MSEVVSERIRALIARSVPLVRQHKDEIISRMELHLRDVNVDQQAVGQSEVVAMMLTELLLKQAAAITEGRPMADVDIVAREHWSLGIEGRHYSRFGDALVPILRDVLGPGAPREVASAWCDTFWATVHPIRAALAA
jgi:hemoglobin-like flavoprotein